MNDCVTTQQISRATWIEVHAATLLNNVQALKARLAPSTRLMAVVKGNAYGHDALAVADLVADAGADWLAVATPGEGLALRRHGSTLPILVLGYTPPWIVAAALKAGLTLTVDQEALLQHIAQIAHAEGYSAPIHVKVNTGMNRLGLQPAAVAPFLEWARQLPNLVLEGLFTHFATADAPQSRFFQQQVAEFQLLVNDLTAVGLRPPLVHAANSAAMLYSPAVHFDLVRCGIALYGLHPDPQSAPLPPTIKPVLRWKAQVVHLTELQPGESVGYGQAFVAPTHMTVATIPVGYADGFPRTPHNWQTVLLHGEEMPLVGRVCMDQAMIDVSGLVMRSQTVQVGDEVVLIGSQGERMLTAEEIGRRTGTINYEVVSRILPRVPRLVV
ncbi:MAG: alanine racemase [Caldilineaceae bacterium]|nr:alanine racemase [Caldilineaceae bacterium]